MKNWIKIFKDNNDWNEKAIIGFIAFLVMVVVLLADVISGWAGKDLVINEFVYDSFLVLVLGCFGIAGLEKVFNKKDKCVNSKLFYYIHICIDLIRRLFHKLQPLILAGVFIYLASIWISMHIHSAAKMKK